MASGYNKPKNLDYVQFTRVSNSATLSSSATNGADSSTTSRNIFAKVKMISPHITAKIFVAAAVLTAVIILVAVTIILAMTLKGIRSQFVNTTSNSQTGVSVSTTSSTTTSSTSSRISLSSSTTSKATTSAFVWAVSTAELISTTSSTLTTKRSPSSSCKKSQFMCSNMECIPKEQVCNGIPDCADGSDESISCVCTEDQFQCPSGQCVPRSAVCDQVYNCLDNGDEANCSDCPGFRCVSNNVCLWDRMKKRCNQVFDCEDLSDEMNCPVRWGRQHLCTNKVQISAASVCDGIDDCGDNSDEESCVCKEKNYQFPCSKQKGRCISSSWVCDGHPDCENGTDEEQCDACTSGNFQCNDYTCVNSSLRCDGKVDCVVFGGDEDGCVELTPLHELRVMVSGHMLPVCSEGWTDRHSAWVCGTLHGRTVQSWTSKLARSHFTKFAAIKDPQAEAGIVNFHITDACKSEGNVHIQCQEAVCGQRKTEVLESHVVGGSITPLGKWPWVISLSYLDNPICAGTLIGSRWVLTAAHCVMFLVDGNHDFSKTPFYFKVTAGAVVIPGSPAATNHHEHQVQPQVVRVSKIIFHPKRAILDSGGVDWDIVLLELETDVMMSDMVQPICLPSEAQVFPATSYCYLAGWGFISYRQQIRAQMLRDTRMQLWSESRCSTNTVVGEITVNTNSTLCGGYLSGRPASCRGDSGGPLMCLDSVSGGYVLAGIVSRGGECGQFQPYARSNRFARVAMAVTWINENMR